MAAPFPASAPASIALPATLTMAEARATLAALAPALQATTAPVVDASALVQLDSAAVAVLLECRRQALTQGRTLQVRGAPAKLEQLARLYGVAGLLGLLPPDQSGASSAVSGSPGSA